MNAHTSSTSTAATFARWVVSIHVLVLLVHMFAAITFISGVGAAYLIHAKLAWVVLGLGILQALAVLSPATPRLHRLYVVFAILAVIGEALQLFLIPRGHLAYHVSVAMIAWGCTLALYVRLRDPAWGRATATAG